MKVGERIMETREQRIEDYKVELDRLMSQCGSVGSNGLSATDTNGRYPRTDFSKTPFALKDRIAELEDLLAAYDAGLA
jgi:hypothetical protein